MELIQVFIMEKNFLLDGTDPPDNGRIAESEADKKHMWTKEKEKKG